MATLADDRADREFVSRLAAEGMEGVRINSAHVTPESLRRLIRLTRDVAPGVKILMDTKGPELRTTALADGLEAVTLAEGAYIGLCDGEGLTSEGSLRLNATGICGCLNPGDRLFIDDGAIVLEAESRTDGGAYRCRIVRGGALGSRKTVSLSEGAAMPQLPAVSERDRLNILAARAEGIDMIAHSFVRSAADVEAVRNVVDNRETEIYAKIECREALGSLSEIAAAADGLLVARGDLGAQIAVERVPAAQMAIMSECRRLGKPAIISTQMLQSMTAEPMPTRAEVNDIAAGVVQGAAWLLLTGETAQGRYPAECVATMRRTIEATEAYLSTGTLWTGR